MGNKASKISQSGRVLAKGVEQSTTLKASAKPSRPSIQDRSKEAPEDGGKELSGDAMVAERLKQLGQIESRPFADQFKPASEDKFTLTLEARQRLESESEAELEKGGPRRLLPATTITAILSDLKGGDSVETVAKTYNLDSSVLPKLEYFSIPEKPQHQGVLFAHDSNTAVSQRQPVRRKRVEKKQ